MARELDDAILSMRSNEPDIGTWLLTTQGDAKGVLDADAAMERHAGHWFVRETIGLLRRTLARLDVTSRTLFALIEPGSCFAGTLARTRLRGGPQLHAARCPTSPRARLRSRCRARTSAATRW